MSNAQAQADQRAHQRDMCAMLLGMFTGWLYSHGTGVLAPFRIEQVNPQADPAAFVLSFPTTGNRYMVSVRAMPPEGA